MEEMIPIAVRKALEKLGVKDESKVFVAKGTEEKTDAFGTGDFYAKISDETPDLHTVSKIYLRDNTGLELPLSGFVVMEETGVQMLMQSGSERIYAVSISMENEVLSKGLYAIANDDCTAYRIETETIQPISDKYLPGVCLPVVELETVFPMGGDEKYLTNDNDTSKLENAAKAENPIIIKFRGDDGFLYTANFTRMLLEGETIFSTTFVNPNARITILLGQLDNSWMLQLGSSTI